MTKIVLPRRMTAAEMPGILRLCRQIERTKGELVLDAGPCERMGPIGNAMLALAIANWEAVSNGGAKLELPRDPGVAHYFDEVGLRLFVERPAGERYAAPQHDTLEMRQLRSQNPVYLRDLADLLAREVKGFSDDVSHLIETCLTELMQNVFEWAQSPTHRRRAGVLMYVIDVWEVCGGKLKDRDDAVPLRRAIQTAWSDEQPVEVDFGDHRIASVSFLDEGIAVLFLEHDVPVVQRRVQLVNITASDRRLLNETIAKRVAQRTSRQPTGPVTSR